MSDTGSLRNHLERFEFQRVFETLGWNRPARPSFQRVVKGQALAFRPIADAGGFTVLEVTADAETVSPNPSVLPPVYGRADTRERIAPPQAGGGSAADSLVAPKNG